jgi:hypothetical protein
LHVAKVFTLDRGILSTVPQDARFAHAVPVSRSTDADRLTGFADTDVPALMIRFAFKMLAEPFNALYQRLAKRSSLPCSFCKAICMDWLILQLCELLLHFPQSLGLFSDLLLLMLHFVQQHWREFLISDAFNLAALIADDKLRIYLCYLLGDQTILPNTEGIRRQTKRDRPQRPHFLCSGSHGLNGRLITLGRGLDA